MVRLQKETYERLLKYGFKNEIQYVNNIVWNLLEKVEKKIN
jgi:hypothetical protein